MSSSLNAAVASLKEESALQSFFGAPLLEALLRLAEDDLDAETSPIWLGKAYLELALTIWHSYVPNIPIDPSVTVQAQEAYLRHQRDVLMSTAVVEAEGVRLPGGRGAIELDDLVKCLAHLDRQRAAIEMSGVHRRADPLLLSALYVELHQFGSSILNRRNLDQLLRSLAGGEADSLVQMQNLRITIQAVIARIVRLYVEYDDMLRPLSLAFASFAIGLDIHIYTARREVVKPAVKVIDVALQSLSIFPTIAACQALLSPYLLSSSSIGSAPLISPAHAALVHLGATSRLTAGREAAMHPEALNGIKQTYDRLLYLWSTDKKNADEEQARQESIYRSRRLVSTVLSDEQIEEAELDALFPSLQQEEEFEANGSTPSQKRLLESADAWAIYRLHKILFATRGESQVSEVIGYTQLALTPP